MDNIFALSTPDMMSAICVFRLTGKDVLQIANFFLKKPISVADKVYYRSFYHPVTHELIDQGIVFYKKAPHSFTGEDMIEIQLHGSRAVIAEMNKALLGIATMRMAKQGEFSQRAFLNNKMDIFQAEALLDLLHAHTDYQRRMALEGMGGTFSTFIDTIRTHLFKLVSLNSAMIDFAEDEVPEAVLQDIASRLNQIETNLKDFLKQALNISSVKQGFKIVIMGAPNAGKSSFINKILQRDAVIVSEQAGTTRDILEFFLDVGGYPFNLIDTAGIRKTTDPLEAMGIQKALATAHDAALILYLQDPSEPVSEFLSQLPGHKIVPIFTKSDLYPQTLAQNHDLHRHIVDRKHHFFDISSQNTHDITQVLEYCVSYFKTHYDDKHKFTLAHQRYYHALEEMALVIERGKNCLIQDDFFLLSENIRIALSILEELTARIGVEEILGDIFSQFCIGK